MEGHSCLTASQRCGWWVVGGLGETVTPHVAQSYRFEGWIETCTCDEISVSYVVCQRHIVPTAIGMYSRNRHFPGASLVLKLCAVPRIERIQYQFCVSHLNVHLHLHVPRCIHLSLNHMFMHHTLCHHAPHTSPPCAMYCTTTGSHQLNKHLDEMAVTLARAPSTRAG